MQFYKWLASGLILVSAATLANDETDKSKNSQFEFLQNLNGKSKEFIEEAKKRGWLDNYQPEDVKALVKQYEKEAKQIAGDSVTFVERELEQKLTSQVEGKPYFGLDRDADRIIFISFSMSRGQIRAAMREAARVKARVVIKGFLKGTSNITETAQRLMALTDEQQTPIQIDPSEFKKWAVTKVPVIAYYDGERSVRAAGVLNFDWLEREIKGLPEETKLYAFGEQGPVKKVEEIDLVAMMKQKLSEYDFETRRKETWNNFWARTYNNKADLPRAEKTETWYIDPTVKVIEDVTNHEGDVLAHKGQVMNPLLEVHSPFRYLVINPQDKEQIAWAKKKLKEHGSIGNVKIMATFIDQDKGWEAYQAIKKDLRWHVFQLPEMMVDRFILSGVPAEIGEHNGLFEVTQYSLKEQAESTQPETAKGE